MRQQHAAAGAGQAVGLGERAQHHQPGVVPQQLGAAGGIRELDVGLVHDHQRPAGQGLGQLQDGLPGHEVAGGIVGRAHVHQFHGRRARGQHGRDIQGESPRRVERDAHHAGPLDARGDRVHAEGRRAHQDLVRACAAEGAGEQVDGLIAAAGDQHVVRRLPVEGGELRHQRARLRFRIAVEAGHAVIAGGPPGQFIGVQPLQGRVPRRMLVRIDVNDVRPRDAGG